MNSNVKARDVRMVMGEEGRVVLYKNGSKTRVILAERASSNEHESAEDINEDIHIQIIH
jgi:hypothetical protein